MHSPGKLTVQRLFVAVFWSAVAVALFKAFVEHEYGQSPEAPLFWAILVVACFASVGAAIGGLLGHTRRGFACGLVLGIIPGWFWYWLLASASC
jgi:hypothetical protein